MHDASLEDLVASARQTPGDPARWESILVAATRLARPAEGLLRVRELLAAAPTSPALDAAYARVVFRYAGVLGDPLPSLGPPGPRFHRAALVALEPLASGRRLASLDGDGCAVVWDTADGSPLAILEPPVAVHPDLDAVLDQRRGVRRTWDLGPPVRLVREEVLAGPDAHPPMAFGPDGRTLYLAGPTHVSIRPWARG